MNETRHANRSLGNAMRLLGWLLQIAGGLSWAVGITWLLLLIFRPYGVAGLVPMFVLLIEGSVAIALGRRLARRGRRNTARV